MMRKTMLTAAAAIASALSGAAAAASGCQSIPMDLSGPRPTVMVRMNGRPPIKAIFDTGNMSTTVDLGQEKELGLVKSGPLELFNQPGAKGYQTVLKDVSVGNYKIGKLSAAALPSMMPGMGSVIGPSAFGNRYVSLDFAGSKLSICPRTAANKPKGAGEPYTAPPVVLPAVTIVAGAQRIAAHIDTGSPFEITLPMSFEKSFTLSEPLKKIGIARSHFGDQPIYRSRIAGPVQIGALRLDNPQVHFSDVVPHPNIGGAMLRRLKITIDPVAKRAWTAVALAVASPAQR